VRRADYDWRIVPQGELGPTLMIVDLDLGGMSLTNDMESVLTELQRNHVGRYENIVYRDSQRQWDCVAVHNGLVVFSPGPEDDSLQRLWQQHGGT
jgi:hypothetical protein